MASPIEIESAARIQFRDMVFNESMSTKNKIRFGNKGSVVVDLAGDRAGRWHSFEDGESGWVDGIAVDESAYKSLVPRRMSYRPDPMKMLRADDILQNCKDPFRTPAETYLASRGIYCSLPHSIKFCDRPCGMAGLFQNAVGDVVAVQVTFLTRAGEKQKRDVPKRTFSTGENWHRYSAIRIPGKGELVICEGIETALSIHQVTGRPVWACTSTSNIASIFVKNRRVTLAHDGDEPGSKADKTYDRTVQRLLKDGKRVRLAKPPTGMDFNDVLVTDGEGHIVDIFQAAELCQRS